MPKRRSHQKNNNKSVKKSQPQQPIDASAQDVVEPSGVGCVVDAAGGAMGVAAGLPLANDNDGNGDNDWNADDDEPLPTLVSTATPQLRHSTRPCASAAEGLGADDGDIYRSSADGGGRHYKSGTVPPSANNSGTALSPANAMGCGTIVDPHTTAAMTPLMMMMMGSSSSTACPPLPPPPLMMSVGTASTSSPNITMAMNASASGRVVPIRLLSVDRTAAPAPAVTAALATNNDTNTNTNQKGNSSNSNASRNSFCSPLMPITVGGNSKSKRDKSTAPHSPTLDSNESAPPPSIKKWNAGANGEEQSAAVSDAEEEEASLSQRRALDASVRHQSSVTAFTSLVSSAAHSPLMLRHTPSRGSGAAPMWTANSNGGDADTLLGTASSPSPHRPPTANTAIAASTGNIHKTSPLDEKKRRASSKRNTPRRTIHTKSHGHDQHDDGAPPSPTAVVRPPGLFMPSVDDDSERGDSDGNEDRFRSPLSTMVPHRSYTSRNDGDDDDRGRRSPYDGGSSTPTRIHHRRFQSVAWSESKTEDGEQQREERSTAASEAASDASNAAMNAAMLMAGDADALDSSSGPVPATLNSNGTSAAAMPRRGTSAAGGPSPVAALLATAGSRYSDTLKAFQRGVTAVGSGGGGGGGSAGQHNNNTNGGNNNNGGGSSGRLIMMGNVNTAINQRLQSLKEYLPGFNQPQYYDSEDDEDEDDEEEDGQRSGGGAGGGDRSATDDYDEEMAMTVGGYPPEQRRDTDAYLFDSDDANMNNLGPASHHHHHAPFYAHRPTDGAVGASAPLGSSGRRSHPFLGGGEQPVSDEDDYDQQLRDTMTMINPSRSGGDDGDDGVYFGDDRPHAPDNYSGADSPATSMGGADAVSPVNNNLVDSNTNNAAVLLSSDASDLSSGAVSHQQYQQHQQQPPNNNRASARGGGGGPNGGGGSGGKQLLNNAHPFPQQRHSSGGAAVGRPSSVYDIPQQQQHVASSSRNVSFGHGVGMEHALAATYGGANRLGASPPSDNPHQQQQQYPRRWQL